VAALKRFYQEVTVGAVSDGFCLLLDGKPVKTPKRRGLVLPTRALADLIAGEWAAQGEVIKPEAMPLTRLANTALDTASRGKVIAELMAFAGHDLLCYRAEGPEVLRAAEDAAWDPYLEWLENALRVRLAVTTGIGTVKQDVSGLKESLGLMEVFPLTALQGATTLSGSLVLALALMKGFRAPEEIWAAAHVDEDYQIAKWGEDAEHREVRAAKAELWRAVSRFSGALK